MTSIKILSQFYSKGLISQELALISTRSAFYNSLSLQEISKVGQVGPQNEMKNLVNSLS